MEMMGGEPKDRGSRAINVDDVLEVLIRTGG